jgi:hypothetical protein
MYLLTHRLIHEATRGPLKLIIPINGTGTLQHDERDVNMSLLDERYINHYLKCEITAQNAIEKLVNATAIMKLPDNQYEITIEFEGKHLTDKVLDKITAKVSVASDKNLTYMFEQNITLFYVNRRDYKVHKMFPSEIQREEVDISKYKVFYPGIITTPVVGTFYSSLRDFFIEVLKSLEKQQDFIEFIEDTTQYGEDIISDEG